MKKRMAIAFLAACLSGGASFAADWPIAAPQLYRPVPIMPIEWTGLYFGVNAGYGWAQGSTNTFFAGDLPGGTTTPLGLGPTELSGTKLNGSGNPNGAIAGGQIGFNWQAGMLVFGAEADGQWLGQQSSFTVVCSSGCVATENVKIKSLATGRARVGLAFDWLLPYVTAGAALVNVSDDLTVTAGGVTGSSRLLAGSTLGWTVGGAWTSPCRARGRRDSSISTSGPMTFQRRHGYQPRLASASRMRAAATKTILCAWA